jgi:predicted esterase
LLRLDIPIYVFHGEADANSDVEGARQLKKSFEKNMKTNLETFLFKGHDHDLNFMEWPRKKTIPEGIEKIFEVAKELNKD